MILVLSTGLGNVSSVVRMIQRVGGRPFVGASKHEIKRADKIVLPGVGSFDNGMGSLGSNSDINALKNKIRDDATPLLGICLGMQLLCRGSEEGSAPGLSLIDADVKKFNFPADDKLKVPHMGWNVVRPASSNPLIPHAKEGQRFYFVHSYRVVPDDPKVVTGTANYGGEFCAAFQQGNLFGVQFHPEKSHRFGMALMKRFVEL